MYVAVAVAVGSAVRLAVVVVAPAVAPPAVVVDVVVVAIVSFVNVVVVVVVVVSAAALVSSVCPRFFSLCFPQLILFGVGIDVGVGVDVVDVVLSQFRLILRSPASPIFHLGFRYLLSLSLSLSVLQPLPPFPSLLLFLFSNCLLQLFGSNAKMQAIPK